MSDSEYRPDVDLESWRWIAGLVAFFALFHVSDSIADWSAREFGPFYAPTAVGFMSGILMLAGLRIFRGGATRSTVDARPAVTQRARSSWKDWLKSDFMAIPTVALLVWFLATYVYPIEYSKAFETGSLTAGFMLGFWSAFLIDLIVQTTRILLRNRPSK